MVKATTPAADPGEFDETRTRARGIARDVAEGLTRSAKRLPAYLFYDEPGSALYEQITELPEYYLTRAEREIFEHRADEIVSTAAVDDGSPPLRVIELGAGTATKSQLLLRAVVRRQRSCLFVPVDVSGSALDIAIARLRSEEPAVTACALVMRHEDAFPLIETVGPRQLVMLIGSSIGNFEDAAARELLRGLRRHLAPGAALLLGTDLRKSPDVLIPAYDDSQGVTAAFNKNVLARINRELGGEFPLDSFRHVALWNDAASRIEMHLESEVDQQVRIRQLGLTVRFRRGERIHTESSVKYDQARVDALLRASGFTIERTFLDQAGQFGVHLGRATW